jgi:Peptidase of plants and bacteria
MGRRERERLRVWAEGLAVAHGPSVARLIGVGDAPPRVVMKVAPDGPPGVTGGRTITLSEPWFREHLDDVGCVLHELAHAYMQAPVFDDTTIWLIEGIADYVRDVLGFHTSWSFAHYEAGRATAGYQTTADFLMWLETRAPGAVAAMSRRLSDGTYPGDAFVDITGARLADLVTGYEADRSGRRSL